MTQPIELPDGRVVVPDNRWDLAPATAVTPHVAVIVPYYDQARQLALVLAALAAQNYPADNLHVTIADDGSAVTLEIDDFPTELDITVVRQDDLGFRAAAARNLGAANSRGEVLCFLDADTVPEPDYVRNAVRLAALVPDALIVGRRLHADLSEIAPDAVVEWMRGVDASDARRESQPGWLTEAYERTGNLLRSGWDAYKYLISAVLTCSRALFDAVGGFDESFVEYGGEDWEFANRAFMMGAVYAHCPDAVAWHDGPDWAGRDVPDRTDEKNAEALALAPLLTDPDARRFGVRYRIPDCLVHLHTAGHSAASLLRTIASILAMPDVAIHLTGPDAETLWRRTGMDDSRVRLDEPDDRLLRRCRLVVTVHGRVVFDAGVATRLSAELAPGGVGVAVVDLPGDASVVARSSRCIHRASRWAPVVGCTPEALQNSLFGTRTCDADDIGIRVEAAEPELWW